MAKWGVLPTPPEPYLSCPGFLRLGWVDALSAPMSRDGRLAGRRLREPILPEGLASEEVKREAANYAVARIAFRSQAGSAMPQVPTAVGSAAGKRRCSANEGEKQKVPSPDSATVFFVDRIAILPQPPTLGQS